jgi:hypothetical protein
MFHIKICYRELGGHTHVSIFMGTTEWSLGKCGDLTFRNEEWIPFKDCFADYTPLAKVEFLEQK